MRLPRHGCCPVRLLPLHADGDRGRRYDAAIGRAIDDFVRVESRRPHVLDYRTGGDAMARMSLRHGARKVTVVAHNKDVARLIGDGLGASGFDEGAHFELLTEMPSGDAFDGCAEAPAFDMLVCEPMGALADSEVPVSSIGEVLSSIKTFAGRRYCIPERVVQYAAVYDFPRLFRGPFDDPDHSLRDWFLSTFGVFTGRQLALFGSHETRLPMHNAPPLVRVPRVALRAIDLTDLAHASSPAQLNFDARHAPDAPDAASTTLLCLEWEAVLYADVSLENTLSAYAALDADARACRAQAWGVVLGYLWDPSAAETARGRSAVSLTASFAAGTVKLQRRIARRVGTDRAPGTNPKE